MSPVALAGAHGEGITFWVTNIERLERVEGDELRSQMYDATVFIQVVCRVHHEATLSKPKWRAVGKSLLQYDIDGPMLQEHFFRS